jgi:hypothetical protein
MKGADFVWDTGKLDSFIAKPDEVVPGNNMKPYGGLASAEDSGLLERDVQCNVLIHDRSPGNKPQRQTWWHASRAESGRADYPMCENNS